VTSAKAQAAPGRLHNRAGSDLARGAADRVLTTAAVGKRQVITTQTKRNLPHAPPYATINRTSYGADRIDRTAPTRARGYPGSIPGGSTTNASAGRIKDLNPEHSLKAGAALACRR